MSELIVALDVPSAGAAGEAVDRLGGGVGFYKIGLELFGAEGPAAVRAVKGRGKKVFLDLKLHDIPRTVGRAVSACAALGADLLTVHASGGRAMIRAAKDAALAFGAVAPKIVAVTLLTSLDGSDLEDLGVSRDAAAQVRALGLLAMESGADGVVCSPREAAAMRAALGPGAVLVTPGVRPAGAAAGDQKRVASPGDAVRAGATHLVVGRPILRAEDPPAAARAILDEMAAAAAAAAARG